MVLSVATAGVALAQLPIKPPPLRASKQPAVNAAAADACPLTVFIDEQGALYDDHAGARHRVTETAVRNDIRAGCKDKGATSSIRVQPGPHTKFGRVQQVLNLVRDAGPNLRIATVTPRTAR
ncbi:hypothetical protein [Terriglobus aquaticus]|uniref:Biopolymer transporter ExbD n=2 Tax=Terriglobus aquaticus TaxID=940139 RepID=A0ABW9KH43_9BACT